MKYIIGTIIFTLVYLADFALFTLIVIMYTIWNFKMPNFEITWKLYHYHRVEGRNVNTMDDSFKDTWSRRCKKYSFITEILKKG